MRKINIKKFDDIDLFFIISYFLGLFVSIFWFLKGNYEVLSSLLGVMILSFNLFLLKLEINKSKLFIYLILFIRYIFILLGFLILYFIFKNINYNTTYIYLAYGINASIGVIGAIIFAIIYVRK